MATPATLPAGPITVTVPDGYELLLCPAQTGDPAAVCRDIADRLRQLDPAAVEAEAFDGLGFDVGFGQAVTTYLANLIESWAGG